MDDGWFPAVDPRETYVIFTRGYSNILMGLPVRSGFWEEHYMVSTPSTLFVVGKLMSGE